jgi:hypothetical protein
MSHLIGPAAAALTLTAGHIAGPDSTDNPGMTTGALS